MEPLKEGTGKKRRRWRRIIILVALLLVVITFTPLVIAPGRTEPRLFSLPYTLWTSMGITILLVVLTYLASRVRGDE